MASGVYEIVCLANGRRYIGSAVNLQKRWREHRRSLGVDRHHSRHMQRAWRKHGEAFFCFRLLAACRKESLIATEQSYIDAFKPEFNTNPTAGSMLGFRHSEESRRKMRASRPKGFSPMRGKAHSEGTKERISENRKGKGGDKGWTQERKLKISSALKGRVITQESRAKISISLTGRKQTVETVQKRTEKLRGRKMPDGFGDAISVRMTGRKLPPAQVQAMAKAKAKLTDGEVLIIRQRLANGEPQKRIARDHSVDPSVVSEINTGKTYRWVK